jgi:hypothetical protein
MYLVSIYFDEKTNKRIQRYINAVAEKSGNTFMLDGNVPPHISVSAFETLDEEQAIRVLSHVATELQRGVLQWVSVGQFFPYVLYIAPVLNEYLHDMSVQICDVLSQIDGVKISPYYQPFQWLPHTTIGKTLSKEQMQMAFEVMQNSFGVFEGEVVRIGLAKPNPHRDIMSWELK